MFPEEKSNQADERREERAWKEEERKNCKGKKAKQRAVPEASPYFLGT